MADTSNTSIDVGTVDAVEPAARSGWARHLLLVVFLLLNLAGMATIAINSYMTTRAEVVRLSQDVLDSAEKPIEIEIKGFLSTASSMTDLLARLATDTADNPQAGVKAVDLAAIDVLRTYDHLAMFNIADTEGGFLMPKKMSDGSIHTKVIRFEDGQRLVEWIRRSPRR